MPRPRTIDPDILVKMLLAGRNQNEIADYFGVTRQAVSDFMRRHNIVREVKRREAMKFYPWDTGVKFHDAWENRMMRDHMEFMATGGEGMQDWKLKRLRGWYEYLAKRRCVVEFDPDIPPSGVSGRKLDAPGGSGVGGFAYRLREESDGDLIIRVNEHTNYTDEGRMYLTLPPELP